MDFMKDKNLWFNIDVCPYAYLSAEFISVFYYKLYQCSHK